MFTFIVYEWDNSLFDDQYNIKNTTSLTLQNQMTLIIMCATRCERNLVLQTKVRSSLTQRVYALPIPLQTEALCVTKL